MFKTKNDLSEATRAKVVELLNARLDDCIDLQTQTKHVSIPKMSSWQRSAWVNRSFPLARRMRGSCRPLPRRQHRYPRKTPQHYALRREKRGQGDLASRGRPRY
jgi:hypothetical protein